jgi:hypothetical protein
MIKQDRNALQNLFWGCGNIWITYGSLATTDITRIQINKWQDITRYKTEALDRRYEKIWDKNAGLVERLHAFQTKHFENRQSIGNLNYESKRCWTNFVEQYITEAASTIQTEMYTLSEFLGARLGVG